MKRKFFDAIRSGDKRTTLRFWKRPMVRAGAVCPVRGLGRLRIERVEIATLSKLTAGDAKADGFASLAALRREIRQLYPRPAREGRLLYKVHFTLAEK